MSKFSRALNHLNQIFPRTGGDRGVLPHFVSDAVVLTHDTLGTLGYLSTRCITLSGAPGTTTVPTQTVTEGRIWRVFAAHVYHSDAVSRTIGILFEKLGEANMFVTTPLNVAANIFIVLERTLYVPPGCRLVGFANGMGAGAQISIQLAYVEIPLGELLPI